MTRFMYTILACAMVASLPASEAAVVAATGAKPDAGFNVIGEVFSWGMTPLWLCSLILVAMVIEKIRSLKPAKVYDPNLTERVATLISEHKLDEAQKVAEASQTVVGSAWAQGLHEYSLGGVSFEEALTNASVLAFKPLRRNLQGIATIGVICPLFGLLGTIVGMIITFTHISAAGGADKAAISGGIAFALVKTAGGLVVAIPAIVSGRYFQGRLQMFSVQTEAAINRLNYRHNHAKARSRGVLEKV